MRTVYYSHLFLALCAAAMIAETAFVFNFWNETTICYTLFVFFATLVAYNIKGVLGIYVKHTLPLSEKVLWAKSVKRIFISGYVISLLAILFLASIIPVGVFPILFLMGILAISYSFPLKIGNYRFSPRDIPFLKTFLVALVWTVVVVYVPCLMSKIPVAAFWHWMAGEFAFLFSLSILFDIKDVGKDKLSGIKTFPQTLGVNATKIISIGLMGARLLLLVSLKPGLALMIEAVVSFIYLVFIVNLITIQRKEKFYMVWIDGLMVGKLAVLLICKFYIV